MCREFPLSISSQIAPILLPLSSLEEIFSPVVMLPEWLPGSQSENGRGEVTTALAMCTQ